MGFTPQLDTPLLEAIEALGVPIATFNYDDLAERVLHRSSALYEETEHVPSWLSGQDRRILHLHGIWNRQESIVFTSGQYERIKNDDQCQHWLRTLFSAHSLLFVGCGSTADDPNFHQLLEWHKDLNKGRKQVRTHFALVSSGDSRLNEEKGPGIVVPLAFGKYSELAKYILDLLADSGRLRTNAGPSPIDANIAAFDDQIKASSVNLRGTLMKRLCANVRGGVTVIVGEDGGEGKTTLLDQLIIDHVRHDSTVRKILYYSFYEQQRR